MNPTEQQTELHAESVSVGLHDMPASRYHSDPVAPSLSSSLAWTLVNRSAMHAYSEHVSLGGKAKEATDAMDFGDVAHQLLLGKGDGIAIWEGDSWRGKDASAFWDKALAEGKTPIKSADYERAKTMRNAVDKQIVDFGLGHLFLEGESEKVSIWKEGAVTCRAMFDRLLLERGIIADIKTMGETSHPKACAARIASMGYDMRSEFYKRGVLAHVPELHGRLRFIFVFVETKPPFAVTPIELNGEWQAIGVSKVIRALSLWEKCLETGKWPGYVNELVRAEPPAWALTSEFGAESNAPQ